MKLNEVYDVIFTGSYLKDFEQSKTDIEMARILKIDVMDIVFMKNKPTLIQSNMLSFDEAASLIEKLYNVGVICVLHIKKEATYQAIGGENKKLVDTVIKTTKKALDYFLNPIKNEDVLPKKENEEAINITPDNTYHQRTKTIYTKPTQNERCKYGIHINSKEWYDLRKKALKRANYKCEMCGANKPLNAHHVRYPIIYKMDHIDNIVIVCRRCHKLSHGIRI
ncbi:MAG: HNH endonuclease [Nitrospirae bacterium]|nr:HNH endonuclease [Nitrospirota bacterium]